MYEQEETFSAKYNRVFATEDGLFRGQHDGSAAPIETSYSKILESAVDYWNSQKWE
jgi:hypothetical protein